jgi:hypothetical protein
VRQKFDGEGFHGEQPDVEKCPIILPSGIGFVKGNKKPIQIQISRPIFFNTFPLLPSWSAFGLSLALDVCVTATAKLNDLVVVTADEHFGKYGLTLLI